jgi:predicted phosphodiesterase
MRVAVVADIHGNLAALQSVMDDFNQVDEVWCLGDIVGYGPDPNKCIELLRQNKLHCITGNHDWAAAGRVQVVDFNPDAAAACQWTAAHLTDENRTFLEGLPQILRWREYTLVHGSLRYPIWEYLTRPKDAANTFREMRTRYCLVGHTHVPVIFEEGAEVACEEQTYGQAIPLGEKRLIINAGSVGQPRDGLADARYLILDAATSTVEYRKVPYDIERTQREIVRAGLPGILARRLSFGW